MSTRKPKFGSIYKRFDKWWIKYYKNGGAIRESSKSDSYADAERLLKRRQGEIVTGKFAGLSPERIRIAELADEVIEEYRRNGRRTTSDVLSRLRVHILPALGEVRAAEFGSRHIAPYVSSRKEAGAANATINRELAIIKRAFALASRADPPLVVRVPHIALLSENNIRTGFLEHGSYIRLRDELPAEVQPIFVVGYHTGARLGELLSLRWSQVDLKANRITLDPGTTKNNEGRTLPIYGEMPHWLAMQKEARELEFPDCPFVFQRSGDPIAGFYKAWRSACKRAEVPGLLFHDLRRTAVRNMVRAGISEKIAMKISGHKTRSVFDRYNIVNERDLTEAAAKMDRYLDASAGLDGVGERRDSICISQLQRKHLH